MEEERTQPELQQAPEQADAAPEAAEEIRTAGTETEEDAGTDRREEFLNLVEQKYQKEYALHVRELLERQAQQMNRYLAFRELQHRAGELRREHPGFDLQRELENRDFARLVDAGVDLKTAYEVVRREELTRAAAAERAAANRPAENGLGRGGAAAVFRTDPRTLTRQERKQLRRRAARGEEIVW